MKIRPALAKGFVRLSGWALEGERPAARVRLAEEMPHAGMD